MDLLCLILSVLAYLFGYAMGRICATRRKAAHHPDDSVHDIIDREKWQ